MEAVDDAISSDGDWEIIDSQDDWEVVDSELPLPPLPTLLRQLSNGRRAGTVGSETYGNLKDHLLSGSQARVRLASRELLPESVIPRATVSRWSSLAETIGIGTDLPPSATLQQRRVRDAAIAAARRHAQQQARAQDLKAKSEQAERDAIDSEFNEQIMSSLGPVQAPIRPRDAEPDGAVAKQYLGGGTFKHHNGYSFTTPANLMLEKRVRAPASMSETDKKEIGGVSLLEVQAGIHGINTTPGRYTAPHVAISLGKQKRWETVPAALASEASAVYHVGKGEVNILDGRSRGTSSRRENTQTTSYVVEDPAILLNRMSRDDRDMEKYLAAQVKQNGRDRAPTVRALRRERHRQCAAIPADVDAPRLSFTIKSEKLSKFSKFHRCNKPKSAKVQNPHHNSYWTPQNSNDRRDFMEIVLKDPSRVKYIGTKGRAFDRNNIEEIVDDRIQCVSRYKLFYKLDNKELWKPLGIFAGNVDGETEVTHVLKDPNTERAGLMVKFLRLQPLNYTGCKALRVGLYGHGPQAAETEKNINLDEVTAKEAKQAAVIYTVKEHNSVQKSGKWAYARKSYGNNAVRALDRNRNRRALQASTKQLHKDIAPHGPVAVDVNALPAGATISVNTRRTMSDWY